MKKLLCLVISLTLVMVILPMAVNSNLELENLPDMPINFRHGQFAGIILDAEIVGNFGPRVRVQMLLEDGDIRFGYFANMNVIIVKSGLNRYAINGSGTLGWGPLSDLSDFVGQAVVVETNHRGQIDFIELYANRIEVIGEVPLPPISSNASNVPADVPDGLFGGVLFNVITETLVSAQGSGGIAPRVLVVCAEGEENVYWFAQSFVMQINGNHDTKTGSAEWVPIIVDGQTSITPYPELPANLRDFIGYAVIYSVNDRGEINFISFDLDEVILPGLDENYDEYDENDNEKQENYDIELTSDDVDLIEYYEFSENEIVVILDGRRIRFDVPPMIIDNRTLVPMRAIFEELCFGVEWNSDTQTIVAERIDVHRDVITMSVGSGIMTVERFYLWIGYPPDAPRPAIYSSERIAHFDVPPQIINNRTMIPLRIIAEATGANVEWDGDTRTVEITSN